MIALAPVSIRFGNRRDGAVNPRPRETGQQIWETHKDDWKRLLEEEDIYVWTVRASYNSVTVLVNPPSQSEKYRHEQEEKIAEKIRNILGEQYGPVHVKIEHVQRGNKPAEGCCGNQCGGCNNGNPERRLYLLG